MARIPLPPATRTDEDEISRAFRLAPAFAQALASYAGAIYGPVRLSMREREAVRMRIAQLNQCQICLGYRFPELEAQGVTEQFYQQVTHWRDNPFFSEREKLALDFTEKFVSDHLKLDQVAFDQLNQHFSAEEMFELTAMIAGLMANGRLMQVLQLNQSCTLNS